MQQTLARNGLHKFTFTDFGDQGSFVSIGCKLELPAFWKHPPVYKSHDKSSVEEDGLMPTSSKITINITLEAVHSPVCEPQQPPTPLDDRLRCELWVKCENPHCLKHGCMNLLPREKQEVH